MSQPMTNIEIEDVLSSIRRLVSEETQILQPRKPEPLLLTPAFRISGDATEDLEAPDAMEPAAPAPIVPAAEASEVNIEPAVARRSGPPPRDPVPAPVRVDRPVRRLRPAEAMDAPVPPARRTAVQDELARILGATAIPQEAVTEAEPEVEPPVEPLQLLSPHFPEEQVEAATATEARSAPSLEDRIADLEAAIGASDEEFEPDGTEESSEDISASVLRLAARSAAEPQGEVDDEAFEETDALLAGVLRRAVEVPDPEDQATPAPRSLADAFATEQDDSTDAPADAEAETATVPGPGEHVGDNPETPLLLVPAFEPEVIAPETEDEAPAKLAPDLVEALLPPEAANSATEEPADALEAEAELISEAVEIAEDVLDEAQVDPIADAVAEAVMFAVEEPADAPKAEAELTAEASEAVEVKDDVLDVAQVDPIADAIAEAVTFAAEEPTDAPKTEAEPIDEAPETAEVKDDVLDEAQVDPIADAIAEAVMFAVEEPTDEAELIAETGRTVDATGADEPESVMVSDAEGVDELQAATGNPFRGPLYSADAMLFRASEPASAAPVAVEAEHAMIDEDSLREIVTSLVREELRGELGERITASIRRLVRREVQKALAVQALTADDD